MDISSLNNSMGAYASSTVQSDKVTKTAESIKDTKNSSDDELREAAEMFETYFVNEMFKGMEKTIPKSKEDDQMTKYSKDMLLQEYSKSVTESGGLGLADALYKQLSKQQ